MKRVILGLFLMAAVVSWTFAEDAPKEVSVSEDAPEGSSVSKDTPKGFSVSVDIDADLFAFKHTDIKNDEYISEEDTTQENQAFLMNNDSFGDTEVKFQYTDPEDLFGAAVVVDFGDKLGSSLPLGDVYGWGRVTKFARFQLGKYTYRAIDKLGGDKEVGVFDLVIDKANNNLSIETSDSLAQSGVIGFLATGIVGPMELGFFAAPDQYFVARYYSIPASTGGTPKAEIPAYSTYNFGFNAKLTLENIATVGASYRQIHTEGRGTSIGDIFHNYGLYARITVPALTVLGIGIGVGYSGQVAYEDADDASDNAPVKSAFHLDATYSGMENKLNVSLFNNVSFYTLSADKTIAYDSDIADVADIYADEASFVLYNELKVAYSLTEKLIPSLTLRNYYGTLTGRNGIKDQDYGLDVFTAEARATYKIKDNAEMRVGLKCVNTAFNTPTVSDVLKNSNFVFSIPIGLTVKW
jgi:hypothetical protein